MPSATSFLICFNALTACVGLGLVGGSIYGLIEFKEYEAIFGEDTGVLVLCMVGGVLTFLVSFLGCWGTIRKKPNFICFYLFSVFVTLGLATAAIVLYFVYTGELDTATNSVGKAVKSETEFFITNSILSIYTVCCSGCLAAAETCNRDEDIAAIKGCEGDNCTLVDYCPEDKKDVPNGCYVYENQAPKDVPFQTSSAICELFKEGWVVDTEHPIVGDPANKNSCGGGDPKKFSTNVTAWVKSKSGWIIGLGVTFMVLLVLSFVSGVIVMCSARTSESQIH